ncbi:hypothetical protein [Halorubrum luteum]
MMATVPSDVLDRYHRFSRYNSPYPAHDCGRAVDLYPSGDEGVSPVSGTVRETRTVGCPERSYAAATDHLIVVDLDEAWCRRAGVKQGTTARILHVTPEVDAGDHVSVGDVLGPMTRSGFFGPWVDNHVHLGFRPPGVSALRASGSLPVETDVDVLPMEWDGTGDVVERGPTYVVLDAPSHPTPGRSFVALASDEGVPLDGGLTHYAGGGTFAPTDGDLSLLGTSIGTVRDRSVEWEPVAVIVNGTRAVGLSLFATRNGRAGVKIVGSDLGLSVGQSVTVTLRETDDPVRLGVG